MKLISKASALLVLWAFLLLTAGCSSSEPTAVVKAVGAGALQMDFSVPVALRSSPTIDTSALSLKVEVNGRELPMNGDSNQQKGVIQVGRGETLTIVATWSEDYDGGALQLAEAREVYTVPVNLGSEVLIEIGADDYFFGFDFDQDGASNLAERNVGSDPKKVEPLADPINMVSLSLTAELPEQLAELSEEEIGQLYAVAEMNRLPVMLTRDNDRWVGGSSFPSGTEVLANYTVYLDEGREVPIAQWQQSRNVGGGSSIYIAAADFDYGMFNADGDDFSNIQEVLKGTNPLDKTDPAVNPCDVSLFNTGCRVDTDGDGKADSMESEGADSDSDGKPDYTEPDNVDADNDGFSAEQDPNEKSVCIPSENSAACIAIQIPDQDNDGVADDEDNCPKLSNADQLDINDDGVGDACKPIVIIKDQDNDGVADDEDNCPKLSNADQLDINDDGVGDACKPIVIIKDQDNDGVADDDDNCPTLSNADQLDINDDGFGDACKPIVVVKDQDKDGIADDEDNCPAFSNNDQTDVNSNGKGDDCEVSFLTYEYYEGKWTKLPDFDSLSVESAGVAETFELPEEPDTNYYAYRFTGQIYIESTGSYTFFSASNDGSKLFVGDKLVVDNDGLHTMLEKQGKVTLKKGMHDITLEYFQYGGTTDLAVSWSSRSFKKQIISDEVLFAR